MKKMITITIVALVLLGWLLVGNPAAALRRYRLKQAVSQLETGELVTLDALVPFDWEKVYTFPPYTSKAQMEETIGFKSDSIQETVSEGMVQLLFVNKNTVTACICGYADALGYSITLEDAVDNGEGILFRVEHRGNIVELTQQLQ